MKRTSTSRAVTVWFLILFLSNVILAVRVDRPSRDKIETDRMGIIANDPHDSIVIRGDANFSDTALAESWAGDGSLQDPYIIEDYDFTLEGATPEASISISDTRVHFVVRDCNFVGPAATPSYGIYLENSTYGRIINNEITNFAHGIYGMNGCLNFTIIGNNVSFNSYGVHWSDSWYPQISQNTCNGNFFDGIYLDSIDEGTISHNFCNENDGRGIHLFDADYNLVVENVCNENSDAGFQLSFGMRNHLENNTCRKNDYGLRTFDSDNNTIQWNVFANSTTRNGIVSGFPSTFQYNYWSDYTGSDADGDGIGDTNYVYFSLIDTLPLMYPPLPVYWVEPVSDQQVEFGLYVAYSIAVFCEAPYDLWMNDSVNFYLDNEVLTSRTILPLGDYPIAANVTNFYGYKTESIFTVMIRDTTPPTITEPEDLEYRVDDPGYGIQWTASDLSPLSYQILRNGTELSTSSTTSTAWYLSIIIEQLPPGIYNYTVVAADTSGNTASDIVLVTILPVPFEEVMLPWLIVGAGGVVVVVVAAIILKKWKSRS